MIHFIKKSIFILGACALLIIISTQKTVQCEHQPCEETNFKISYHKNDSVGSVEYKNTQKEPLKKLQHHCHRATLHRDVSSHPTVQKYVRQFKQEKSEKIWETKPEVKSHLNYILGQLENRDLPGELALVPMIESKFKTEAKSHRGAVGLWQFMPKTGRAFGLKCNAKYDGRKDVKASTNAALNYLEYLHKKFNRDWMLALAAYNAGEGTVQRAMNRNKRQGKSTSFWSLKLPYETTQYVPKLLGLVQYIKQLK